MMTGPKPKKIVTLGDHLKFLLAIIKTKKDTLKISRTR